MRTLILFIASFLLLIQAFAQQIISGKVTDLKTGAALAGASVRVKSTKKGTSTTSEGNFKIEAVTGDLLEITSIGYKTQSLTVSGTGPMTIALENASAELAEIVFVGSRGGGRAKTETTVPVDVIRINQVGLPTAKMDLSSVLNMAAPSFNYNKQTGADGADHIDIATLRGLSPDHTLVLVNGKRWHKTAFVGLFGTRGKGSSGTDLNAIPEDAIDRVEILRDGASAQYGSDAIAGVINIILKKDVNHLSINTGYSVFDDQKYNAYNTRSTNNYYYSRPFDGATQSIGLNYGLPIGKQGGFINFSADFLNQAKTYRQVADTNVFTNPKALPVNYARRAFGDGSVTTAGAMFNAQIPLSASGKTTFYAFGNYNYKASDAFAYTRDNGDPTRFPVDNGGNIIMVPGIMHTASDGTVYYNPHIQTHITDIALAAGVKGDAGNGWDWDLSNTIGYNNFHYYGDKTFNASILGASSPTHFDDGGFSYLENTVNLDVNKSFAGVASGLNLGLGAEYRYENYKIYNGEVASWQTFDPDTIQAPGSQGFPGFRPSDNVNASRSNVAGYIDAELNVTKEWLVDGAVRFENYSDFGFTSNYKLATRYKLGNHFNLRSSVSTGFRAPSLQQINFSNTLTTFVGPDLFEEQIASNHSAIAKAAGIPDLKQEKSLNGSVGFSWKPVSALTITVDGYLIKIKDRVVLSGLFSSQDNSLSPDLLNQLNALHVALAQFFSNAVNTTNRGIDILIDYNKRWGNKGFKALLAGNIQGITINAIHVPSKLNDSYLHQKTFFSDREESFVKASAPKSKFSLNLEYSINKFAIGTHLTRFGDVKLLGFGYTGLASAAGTGGPGDPDISGSFAGIDPYVDVDGYSDGVHVTPEVFDYKPKIVTDLYVSYKFCKQVTFFAGADNIFNVHPSLGAVPNARYEAFDNEGGGPWDSVQMGFDGRRLFGKLAFSF